MEQTRIAVIGSGYFSQFHLAAWQRLHVEGATLSGLLSLDDESAKTMCERFSIARRYNSIDELIADKPDLVSTLEEARTAVDYCARRQVPLVVHENFRHQPWYRAIKAELDKGRLGTLYQLTFRIRPGDRQPYFREQPQFLVRETAVHWIDVFRFLAGEVESVFASLSRLNPAIQGEDAGIMLLRFASGARGLIDGNRLSDHNAQNTRLTMGEMLVEGEKGVLALNGCGEVSFRAHGSQTIEPIVFDWQNIDFAGDCVYLTQKHILASIFNKAADTHPSADGEVVEDYGWKTPENTADRYLINRVVESGIYESSQRGCWVSLL